MPLPEASLLFTPASPSFPKSVGLTAVRQDGKGTEAGRSHAIQDARWQKTHQPDAELCKTLSKNHVMLLLDSSSDPNGEAAWKARDGQAHRQAGSSTLKPNSINFCHSACFLRHRDASCLSTSRFLEGKPSSHLHRF